MVTLATILDLPLDDDEAFLAFEESARQTYERNIREADREESWGPYWLTYMAHVSEAASEFGVERVAGLEVLPPIRSEEFAQFQHEVLGATTRLKFRVARRMRRELIEPDTSDREKVKFRIQQLRNEVGETSLPQSKKDALNKKLDELEKEFEGKSVNRAAVLVILTACAALVHQTQGVLLKGPETIVSIMDTINMVIGKEEERRSLLERYRKPLAIEDKSDSAPKGYAGADFEVDLDDEIPF
jgi:hypothetical protein